MEWIKRFAKIILKSKELHPRCLTVYGIRLCNLWQIHGYSRENFQQRFFLFLNFRCFLGHDEHKTACFHQINYLALDDCWLLKMLNLVIISDLTWRLQFISKNKKISHKNCLKFFHVNLKLKPFESIIASYA